MHSQSRKWIAPKVQVQAKHRRYNDARHKLCKRSFAWPINYDFDEHKKLYTKDLEKQFTQQAERLLKHQAEREQLGLSAMAGNIIKPAFGGKEFGDNRATVMCMETVFSHEFEKERRDHWGVPKPIAGWACREELKYEGDDRILTDDLHRRFLGVPRVPANATVNWMQRSFIDQYPFEDYYFYPMPNEDDVFWRHFDADDREIIDEDGRQAIGNELMDILDE